MNLQSLGIWGLVLIFLVAACSPGGPAGRTQEEPEATPVPATPYGVGPPTAPGEPPTKVPGPSPAVGGPVYVIAPARAAGFAPSETYELTVSPALAPYSTDLAAVANPADVQQLNEAQRAFLQKNGFVVVPGRTAQIYQVYQQLEKQGQPVFVTTDALLHSYHVLYDYTLRYAEISRFVADLQGLVAAMLSKSQEQMAGTSGEVQAAARRNVAFFAVAASLLDPAFKPPAEVRDLVAQELALIDAHSGFSASPIFGYEEDYSQYVPRGHYTRNEVFGRYFKAMMWLGRIGFRLRPGEDEASIAAGRSETRQAILIVAALHGTQVGGEPALATWERIYEPTVFFVGAADDLTVYDYTELIRQVYGEQLRLDALADDARLDDFIARGRKLRPPKIVSGHVTDQQDVVAATQGFRFMGQRYIPDSYIIQQLVYDKVGTQDDPRGMPNGLDVAAALGSGRAWQILDQEYKETHYANYGSQMEKVRGEFAALPPEQWGENLYWSWLHSLRPLLEVRGEGYPTFMRSPAWVDKDLHTFLGSWAELRHDTILYAKQSYAVEATSLEPQPPQKPSGYVEPRPEVFGRLAILARKMRQGLDSRGLLNDEFRSKLSRLDTLLAALTRMAEKELAGEPLSAEEQEQISHIGDALEGLTTFTTTEAQGQLGSETDERMAIIADVHTDPNSKQVLEVGVGDAFLIFVVAPLDGRPTVAQGGVFSYYEFGQPMTKRLTDEAWQAMSPRPAQPVWTQSFIR
jgi:hypothetical protein